MKLIQHMTDNELVTDSLLFGLFFFVLTATKLTDRSKIFYFDRFKENRLGDEERRLMHLVPAPAVRLMKRRVLSRPGVNSLLSFLLFLVIGVMK